MFLKVLKDGKVGPTFIHVGSQAGIQITGDKDSHSDETDRPLLQSHREVRLK